MPATRSTLPDLTPAEWTAIRAAVLAISTAAERLRRDVAINIATDGVEYLCADLDGVQPPEDTNDIDLESFEAQADLHYGNDKETGAVVSWAPCACTAWRNVGGSGARRACGCQLPHPLPASVTVPDGDMVPQCACTCHQ